MTVSPIQTEIQGQTLERQEEGQRQDTEPWYIAREWKQPRWARGQPTKLVMGPKHCMRTFYVISSTRDVVFPFRMERRHRMNLQGSREWRPAMLQCMLYRENGCSSKHAIDANSQYTGREI